MVRHARRILFGQDTQKVELLRSRIDQLQWPLKDTLLAECIRQVRRELRRAGITRMNPVFYLSNEYGTVVGTANIGLGFWDADPVMWELYRESRGTANSKADIMLLLRHECGHAFCYSYKLYRSPEFRKLFRVRGNFFWTYPKTDRYVPNPWSKDFVNPFGDHYAQKHPDDDFADTFAARMVRQYGRRPPLIVNDEKNLDLPVTEMRQTVREFLRAPIGRYKTRAEGYIDPDLETMFIPRRNGTKPASGLIQESRRQIERRVAAWSGAPIAIVRDILEKIAERSDALNLGVKEKRAALVDLSAYVCALATRYVTTGRFRP
jgi:hypothetical protein